MLQNSSSDDEEEDDKTEGTVCSLQQQGSSRGDICLPWGGGGLYHSVDPGNVSPTERRTRIRFDPIQ